MQSREIELKPGAFGWAVGAFPYSPPKDLPHRTLVKVIENRVGDTTMTVQNREGQRWTMLRCNVTPRLQYWVGEKWYPESHPKAQSSLLNEIRRQWKELEIAKARIENLYWRVRRSGSSQDVDYLETRLEQGDPIADFDASPKPPIANPMHPGEGAGGARIEG